MKRFWKGKRSVVTSPVTTPDPRLDKVEYARQLLAETREEVARSDAKASLLFSAFGVVTSAVAAILIADDWSPFDMDNAFEWLWWVGVVLSGVALLVLGLAVIPRVQNTDGQVSLYFFGHVAGYKRFHDFEKSFEGASTKWWDRTLNQIWVESRIARRKYRLTKWSMWLFACSVGLLLLAALLDEAFA